MVVAEIVSTCQEWISVPTHSSPQREYIQSPAAPFGHSRQAHRRPQHDDRRRGVCTIQLQYDLSTHLPYSWVA